MNPDSVLKKTLDARGMTYRELKELFDIDINWYRIYQEPWELESEPHEVPVRLRKLPLLTAHKGNNLHNLKFVLYDKFLEATVRIAADTMLVQSCLLLAADSTRESPKGTINPRIGDQSNKIKLYPELEISIEVTDHRTGKPITVQERADWAFGYGAKRENVGSFLSAIKAKQRSEYSEGEIQLLAYLCILLQQSRLYNIYYGDKDLKMVFNFIMNLFEVTMENTSNATLTKPGMVKGKEVEEFQEEMWGDGV
ncbi:hypothetical protein GP486_006748 [Trichoglossum hirsutum]|uniref:Uncharacterized protein n=1 Tax=Trichoglossum hirsutum TaxID=265104 RepID=A0A9P8IGU5_9PEZI|nr:hypothetical protein GP486_006748 [Trichoglossum hirsutum]